MWDYALVQGSNGETVAHKADCTVARSAALLGMPVATLLGCENPLPDDFKKHSCLDGDGQEA